MNEKNPDAKKYEILDTLITQYTNRPYKPKVNHPLELSSLWDSYAFYSKADGDKLPKDWAKRQNTILDRDKKRCQRCSKKVDTRNCKILFIKPINDGGSYYLKNMVLVCDDCKQIEDQKINPSINLHTLEIKEKLYTFVH